MPRSTHRSRYFHNTRISSGGQRSEAAHTVRHRGMFRFPVGPGLYVPLRQAKRSTPRRVASDRLAISRQPPHVRHSLRPGGQRSEPAHAGSPRVCAASEAKPRTTKRREAGLSGVDRGCNRRPATPTASVGRDAEGEQGESAPRAAAERGATRIRTGESRFCRPFPYHLGMAPKGWKDNASPRIRLPPPAPGTEAPGGVGTLRRAALGQSTVATGEGAPFTRARPPDGRGRPYPSKALSNQASQAASQRSSTCSNPAAPP